jgi:hypothetical protein
MIFNQKNFKNVNFLLQGRHLKPKIDHKNNGKWKLQTCFSRNYDFAFTNLSKNSAELHSQSIQTLYNGQQVKTKFDRIVS